MATYSFIRESVVQGVIRGLAQQPRNTAIPPPLDRIRAIFDASFFSINSQTSQAYGATEDRREMLRVARTVTFVSGNADLPTDTLKAYIEDCTFFVSGKKYSFRRYPQWIRTADKRLGYWTQLGDTLMAKVPMTASPLSGDVTFSSIESPPVPVAEGDEFACPDDYLPDFEASMIQYILGQTMEMAAQTA